MSTLSYLPQDDAIITASIKALAAARDMSLDSVAVHVSMTPRTLYRRMKAGKWTAGEVSRFAVLFGTSRESLYTGVISVGNLPGPEPTTAESVGRVGLEPTPGGEWVRGLRREYGLALLPELAAA